jgi:hypothetical protein
MSYGQDRRLEKLESVYVTGERPWHAVEVIIKPWEPGAFEKAAADQKAEIAKLIASGRAQPTDDFHTIRRIIVRPEMRDCCGDTETTNVETIYDQTT